MTRDPSAGPTRPRTLSTTTPGRESRRALLLGALLAACWPAACRGPTATPPRGVLLITVDTLRADHLGCQGGPAGLTPRIDRLASEGACFLDASSPVPITLPAHASILTGVTPPVHGVRDNGDFRLGPQLPTLAERLAAAGWTCGAFVGAVVLDSAFGLDRGFAHYDDDIAVPAEAGGGGIASYPERPAGAVVDAALAFIGSRPAGSPFFAWVHLFDPHAPYSPPEPHRARHGATYRGEVAATDAEVGRLLDGLERLGRAGDTLVVFTSDHGEGLGEHGETTHGFFLYQSTIHVPLILRLPGRLPPGRTVAGPASLLDIVPTALELAGLPPVAGAEGVSLVPAARGEALPRRTLYLETYLPYFQMRWSGSRGVRQGSWKLLRATSPELYDLVADASERSDLAEGQADRATAMGAELDLLERAMTLARAPDAGAPALDEHERARLRSLGYLSGGSSPDRDRIAERAATRPDTRERIHLVDALQEAAPAAVDRGDPGALARLADLVGQDPGNPRLRTVLGKALMGQARVDEALAHLQRAVELDPADPRASANLGAALLRAGRSADAEEAVDRALALDAVDPEIRRIHGVLLLDVGRAEQAEARFRDLLRERPGDAAALGGLGRALSAQGRWAEAIAPLEALLAQEPRSANALALAGSAAYELRRDDTAERRFRRALEIAPEHVEALLGLGIVVGERGDDAGAARLFERAARASPDDPTAFVLLGVAAARAGDVPLARQSLERALAIDPGQGLAREVLSELGP